jgi:hypothetical protein
VIRDLLNAGSVKFLSIESWIAPNAWAGENGEIHSDNVLSYFNVVQSHPNAISSKDLTDIAMKVKVPVNFHDMPPRASTLAGAVDSVNTGDKLLDKNAYVIQAKSFITEQMTKGKVNLPKWEGAAGGVPLRARNAYSANYLKSKLGDKVGEMPGLVLLVGAFHTVDSQCGTSPGNTTQGRLGIGEERVFRFGYSGSTTGST